MGFCLKQVVCSAHTDYISLWLIHSVNCARRLNVVWDWLAYACIYFSCLYAPSKNTQPCTLCVFLYQCNVCIHVWLMSLSTCLAAFFTHFDAELEFLLVLPDMLKGGSHSWNAWYNVHACTEQNAVAVDCNSSNVRIYHVFIRLSGLLLLRRICYLQHLCFFQEDPSNVPFPDTKFMLSWGEPPREDKAAFVLWVKSGIKWYMKTYIHLAGAVWITGIFRSLTLSKHPVSDWRKEEKTLIKAHIHALNADWKRLFSVGTWTQRDHLIKWNVCFFLFLTSLSTNPVCRSKP